jgi:DNA polymerase-3 subunit beta
MRIGAKVDVEGAITIPARTLSEMVATLPAERIDLDVDMRANTLNLRCGSYVANIRGLGADMFPPVPEGDADTGIELPAQALKAMIDQTVFAAAREDNRPILMGVQARFDGSRLALAAADGYRMALRTAQLESAVERPLTLIIPARTLEEVARIIGSDDGSVYISVPPGRNQVMFHLKDADVVSQLIDGKFPDADGIIPKAHNTTTTLQVADLLAACRRSEIFARDDNYTTRLRIEPESGQIVITARSPEKGDNEGVVEANINGGTLEVAFNVRYLIDVLKVVDADQVVLETNGAAAPGVIKPSGRTDFVYVVMPMSVRG